MLRDKDLDKEFDETFLGGDLFRKEAIKGFIDKNYISKGVAKLPMGVSQWANHGKKHGYWNYFGLNNE